MVRVRTWTEANVPRRTDGLAGDDAEPGLDLIQPAGALRGEVERCRATHRCSLTAIATTKAALELFSRRASESPPINTAKPRARSPHATQCRRSPLNAERQVQLTRTPPCTLSAAVAEAQSAHHGRDRGRFLSSKRPPCGESTVRVSFLKIDRFRGWHHLEVRPGAHALLSGMLRAVARTPSRRSVACQPRRVPARGVAV